MNNLETMHSKLLSMLLAFDEICKKNKLKYYMVYGTCLGAVRHKGFIPWDDDVDVAMPRDDYKKLCSIPSSEFPDIIKPLYYKNTRECPIHFFRVVDINTTLIENDYHRFVEGLYLDIFPLDGVMKTEITKQLRLKTIWTLHSMIRKHCSTYESDTMKRKIKKVIATIIPLSIMHNLLEMLMTKYSTRTSEYWINFLGAYGVKEIIPSEFFGEPKMYDFEGYKLYGPQYADKYLSHIYGNYMELPPEEKRVCRHNQFYVNLDKPFKEYSSER